MYKREHDEGHDCTYISLLTKKLTLNDTYILCTLFELNDIVKNLNPELKYLSPDTLFRF